MPHHVKLRRLWQERRFATEQPRRQRTARYAARRRLARVAPPRPPALEDQHYFSAASAAFLDPHAFLGGRLGRDKASSVRRLEPLERKALEALGLDETADRARIKTRFKELVKRHHPDANGGDKRSENKLREIIQAYNYLKQAGLV